jgi:hypothetical protein
VGESHTYGTGEICIQHLGQKTLKGKPNLKNNIKVSLREIKHEEVDLICLGDNI